jgi:hypothetical protein
MARTFRHGVRLVWGRPALIAIFAIALFYGASSEPFDRFWELRILDVTSCDVRPRVAMAVQACHCFSAFVSVAFAHY